MQRFTKVGLDALLTPENCALLLIDHQPFQLANVNSHEPTMVINNVTALAKTAKAYGIPAILTTVNEERGGAIFKQLQAVFPDQKTINRTFINSWEDRRIVEAVKRTGRKKLVMAALWTEMCLAMPAIHAMGDGYDVYIVTDASGGVSPEAHDIAVRRMVAAGAQALPVLDPKQFSVSAGVAKGAYVLLDEHDPDLILVATGSEVQLALEAARTLAKSGTRARVVSMPSWELFAKQPAEYRDALLPVNVPTLAIEAGATLGWYKWVGRTGDIIGLDHFGASAPGEVVMEKLGFNVGNVVHRALQLLHRESTPATRRTWVNAGGKT